MLNASREARAASYDWFPDWSGATVVLVASGPSAKDVPLEMARGRAKFIAINNSVKLAPWADVLYACDANWWLDNDGAKDFAGLKVTQDNRAHQIFRDVRRVVSARVDALLLAQKGVIGWGGNSGFQAINLAVQWGAKRLILVGYDMTLAGGSHWHGDHAGTGRCTDPNVANVARWCRAVDGIAPHLASAGVSVANCSPVSRLQAYPKETFAEALAA